MIPASHPCPAPGCRRRRLARRGAAAVPLLLVALAALPGGCGGKAGASGAALYRTHCAHCHGTLGTGDPRSVGLYPGLDLTTSRLVGAGEPARGAIYQRIADGYGAMPGFSAKLGTDDIEAVIDTILRLPRGKASR